VATLTKSFESLNPATGEVIESFPRSSVEDEGRLVPEIAKL